ncbi:MAG: hypothetical protein M1482_14735 [Chloroflexi bacterium]|nr:hypothetical protein [Chloroflexota bacterium]
MPRRSKPKSEKRTWRWWASMALNGAVAVSMVLGTVFLFTGAPVTSSAPTLLPPTADANATLTPIVQPTAVTTPVPPTATPAPATATPKADAGRGPVSLAWN